MQPYDTLHVNLTLVDCLEQALPIYTAINVVLIHAAPPAYPGAFFSHFHTPAGED
jgi:hypothetical protein